MCCSAAFSAYMQFLIPCAEGEKDNEVLLFPFFYIAIPCSHFFNLNYTSCFYIVLFLRGLRRISKTYVRGVDDTDGQEIRP